MYYLQYTQDILFYLDYDFYTLCADHVLKDNDTYKCSNGKWHYQSVDRVKQKLLNLDLTIVEATYYDIAFFE